MDKNKYLPRLIDERIKLYLSTFGAVCIEGPKWCGKTWTGSMHAKSDFLVGDPANNFSNRELARSSNQASPKSTSPRNSWTRISKPPARS